VRIEFNPAKDRENKAAHGVSLSLAHELDWDAALVWVDDRFKYDELRMIALAPKTNTVYYVAFVDRGEVRRVISLRRATRREVYHYVQNVLWCLRRQKTERSVWRQKPTPTRSPLRQNS
jgi:uncharacterized protein